MKYQNHKGSKRSFKTISYKGIKLFYLFWEDGVLAATFIPQFNIQLKHIRFSLQTLDEHVREKSIFIPIVLDLSGVESMGQEALAYLQNLEEEIIREGHYFWFAAVAVVLHKKYFTGVEK